MPSALRAELLALNQAGADELARAAANALARLYADTAARLLDASGVAPRDVIAIGVHGQTVRHRPDSGYTVQLNAPALGRAERHRRGGRFPQPRRGRRRPGAPPFHAAIFGAPQARAVLNLGGIANVTLLAPGAPVRGFDTGPANVLLDGWCQRHLNQPFDADGRWAARCWRRCSRR